MNRLEFFTTELVLAAAATTLPLPPSASFVFVPTDGTWGSSRTGIPGFMELEIWGPGAVSMTNVVLYGARMHALVYADQTVTFTGATNLVTKATHGLLTGDGPLPLSNVGGAMPVELQAQAAAGFYVIKVDANTFKLAATFADSLSGTAIDFTGNGTGTTTISDTADTERISWSTHDGLLGLAEDGAIAIAADVGYSKRVPHSPRVVAYALVGTLDTGNVSASLFPVQGR